MTDAPKDDEAPETEDLEVSAEEADRLIGGARTTGTDPDASPGLP